MDYTPFSVTERILKLKEIYKKSTVAIEDNPYAQRSYKNLNSGDRFLTLGFLEGWLKHEDAPTTFRRRAYAEAEELLSAEPIIEDYELITGQPYLPKYSPEQKERYLHLYEMFKMSNITTKSQWARGDHIGIDFDKLLRVGVRGLIDEIKQKQAELNTDDRNLYPDLSAIEKNDYYESCLIELEALNDLAKRYAKKARDMADSADGTRKKELTRMADALCKVPEFPAETFFEAVQSVQFFIGTVQGLYPLNRPDRYLYPFYKRDIENGIITKAEVQEIIDNLCLLITTRVFSRSACGFMVGGRNADGEVVENDLTYMFLTALDHIRLPDPNGALAVCEDTGDGILRYSAEILSRGVTHPAFFNDEEIVKSLEDYGCSHTDAVNYIHSTCAEICVIGKSRGYTTPFVTDVPRILSEVTHSCSDEVTFEEIKQKLIEKIYAELREQSKDYLYKILEARRNARDPIRISCLVDDCIKKGRSYWDGGERYTFIQPIAVGIGTAVDSLSAINHLVFKERKLKLSEFTKIIDENFEGNEALRQYIINRVPHYGNDIEEVDGIAAWIYKNIENVMKNHNLAAGNIMVPGTFSYILHEITGRYGGASYDGRLAGVSYSDGCCAVQGRDTSGPTATVLSLTSFDQSAYLAGMVVNMKFSPEHLTKQNADLFITLLRTFMKRGGIEMQVNAVDRATLLDAKKNPEAHRDLLVRIGGYSDYFVRLSDGMQNEVIERTEH